MKQSVLHLVDSFHQGGSERQAIQLVEGLSKEGSYNIFLATLNREGILREKVEEMGFHNAPEFKLTSFHDLNFVKQLGNCIAYMRKNKIGIVHTHDFYTNIFGISAGFAARVPVRIASRRETTGIRTAGQKRIERWAYRLSHTIVANAQAVREHLVKEGIHPKKTEVIYNGLDLARVVTPPSGPSKKGSNDILDRFGIQVEPGVRFVTIVANFRLEVKDYPTFLRAASQIRDNVPNTKFILVGHGPLFNKVKRLSVDLGLEGSSFFTGECDSVAELLEISDVCVLSSRAEGFSNAILEYMAAGRPVVATNVGGAGEMIVDGETGFLVDAGDDTEMAKKITQLLNEPETAKKMGERGKNIVTEKFSRETQLQNTLDLYSRLTKRNLKSRF